MQKYSEILEYLKEFYKSLEKCYRRTLQLYEFFDKELKIKDDAKLKEINNIKDVKLSLDELNNNIQEVEYFVNQGVWLQERFPTAKYEDVVGLCKVANIEEIKEQDYSLNPGRYVGVLVEEDGLTEEEFQQTILNLESELKVLNNESHELEFKIAENIRTLVKVDEE